MDRPDRAARHPSRFPRGDTPPPPAPAPAPASWPWPWVPGCPAHGDPDCAPLAWDGCLCRAGGWTLQPAPGITVVLPAHATLGELLHAADTVPPDASADEDWRSPG